MSLNTIAAPIVLAAPASTAEPVCTAAVRALTVNPRAHRALQALVEGDKTREQVDAITGSSNGPDIIQRLRRFLGSDIITTALVQGIDRDGNRSCPGVYRLNRARRPEVLELLKAVGPRRPDSNDFCCVYVPNVRQASKLLSFQGLTLEDLFVAGLTVRRDNSAWCFFRAPAHTMDAHRLNVLPKVARARGVQVDSGPYVVPVANYRPPADSLSRLAPGAVKEAARLIRSVRTVADIPPMPGPLLDLLSELQLQVDAENFNRVFTMAALTSQLMETAS
ncbi:MAG: hypothetical protein EKK45_27870 [Curvibacter sp.]|nr:MAG: hypothetical protein EKK45_27870 [Curvibacter sp.]